MTVGCTITEESFARLTSYWKDSKHQLGWNSVFILPAWLEVWWQAFGGGADLYLRGVWQKEKLLGIAPLLVHGETASIIGSADVCDYVDFVVAPGRGRDFFAALLDDLRHNGINRLDLNPLKPDSIVFTDLTGIAQEREYGVLCHEEEVTVEMDLPSSWDEYLVTLTTKQRHEVKRKLRRLQQVGNVDYRCTEAHQEVGHLMDTFLKLFSLSRKEKAGFMTARVESFFRSLAEAMADIGLLRFGILEVDALPAAMTMGFDYNDTVYLYNSAYDPNYSYLSVGLLSKVLGIKESIKQGRKRWDFLKGGEPYKYQLGGEGIPISSCQITIR